MARIIKRASLNNEEQEEYQKLSDRLGISNESDLLKKAIKLTNKYLDIVAFLVPQEIIECKLDKLRYSEKGRRKRK